MVNLILSSNGGSNAVTIAIIGINTYTAKQYGIQKLTHANVKDAMAFAEAIHTNNEKDWFENCSSTLRDQEDYEAAEEASGKSKGYVFRYAEYEKTEEDLFSVEKGFGSPSSYVCGIVPQSQVCRYEGYKITQLY